VSIPILDLAALHESIRPELDEAISRVIASSSFVLGPEVEAFEAEFAAYCEARDCVGVANGTDALQLALLALDVGPGDEVVMPAHTFGAAAFVTSSLRATPVFVDIDASTYTLDAERLHEAITPRTRAIVPVHLYGQCADMDAILEIAHSREIPVIEDAAQAHGATFRGRKAGCLGDLACFSFYPTKNLGCLGDGGAVTTSDKSLADRLRSLRDYGRVDRYRHAELGVNSRLDEVQAAVLRTKLPYLDEWNAARQRAARMYDQLLGRVVGTPTVGADRTHVYHLYVVRSPDRDRLKQHLAAAQIQTEAHYPVPLHAQPLYEHLPFRAHSQEDAEKAADEVLSLPLFPTITEAQIGRVAENILDFVQRPSPATSGESDAAPTTASREE